MSYTYRIYCTKTGYSYIGYTKQQLSRRYTQHRQLLYKNKHHSITLQNDWGTYGKSAFVFSKLANCDVEKFWLTHLYPLVYNKWVTNPKGPSKGHNKGHKKPKHVIEAARKAVINTWATRGDEMRWKCRRLTKQQIQEIRKLISESVAFRDIGKQYGVSASTICHINTGKRYSEV